MQENEGVVGRASVRLTLDCNNHCVFCGQEGLPPAESAVTSELTRARATHDEVTFVGGEPTLYEGLEGAVVAARAQGFRRVGIQTNGARFAELGYATKLAKAGLTDVHFSLHGAEASVHDYHTERPGSFDHILAAIHAARVNELPVVVTTVLTKSNFRVLGAMPPLLAARGVAAWLVSVPAIAGRAAVLRDRVVPRLGLALPFALHALGSAHALRMPAWMAGAPLCLLGPFAEHVVPTETRAYAPVCDACPGKSRCPGVDAEYLARFEGDELSLRDAFPRKAASTSLTAMFVGPGELAPQLAAAVPAVARPRTSLPMLGKVKPALAEASSATQRRTGGALKEIFPTLFEPTSASSVPEDDSKS